MEEFVAKYNNYQINDASKITTEIFELQNRNRRQKQRQNNFTSRTRFGKGSDLEARLNTGSYGSHYKSTKRAPKEKPKSVEDLDAELDAYMNS